MIELYIKNNLHLLLRFALGLIEQEMGIGQSNANFGALATWKKTYYGTIGCQTSAAEVWTMPKFKHQLLKFECCQSSNFGCRGMNAEVWTGSGAAFKHGSSNCIVPKFEQALFKLLQYWNFGSWPLNGHCRQMHTILHSPGNVHERSFSKFFFA